MMRKPIKKSTRKSMGIVSRRHRLKLLATLMVGSGICSGQGTDVLAANPGLVTRGTLPPLPVEVSSPKSGIHTNPFFQPTKHATDPTVQLASGDAQSAIRLRPIGAPIDLNTIGEDPVRIRPSSIVIDEATYPDIRNNPLIGSAHHENASLVESPTSDVQAQQQIAAATDQARVTSSIPEFRPPLVPSKPVSDHLTAGQFVARDGNHQEPILHAAPATGKLPIQLAADAREDREPIAESQPIYFSISDNGEAVRSTKRAEIVLVEEPHIDFPEASETVSVEVESKASVVTSTETAASEFTAEPSNDPVSMPEPDAANMNVERAAPVLADGPAAPIHLAEEFNEEEFNEEEFNAEEFNAEEFNEAGIAEEKSLADNEEGDDRDAMTFEPEDSQPAPKAIYRDEPVVAAPVAMPEPTLVQQRYRPPVAVDSPPIAITREIGSPQDASSLPTVQSVEAPMIVLEDVNEFARISDLPAVAKDKPSALYMTRTQVRSLTIGGHVRRIAVGDKNVCQAFAAGPNQLKLIGTGNGVTQLVVWADTTDSTPTRIRSFEIHVEDKATSAGVIDKATVLNESIRRAFPTSRINVLQMTDCLVVNGDCQSEETAKEIVRMIRKTYLIPVRDEIQVR